tara:strand:+ start:6313 stop:6492 length:180 start_codon:yes stop_codon:yes gene_type:complete
MNSFSCENVQKTTAENEFLVIVKAIKIQIVGGARALGFSLVLNIEKQKYFSVSYRTKAR